MESKIQHKMNISVKRNRFTVTENRLMVARRQGRGIDWESMISRYKLLYIEQINKVLLYSTGSYIQYPEINHNGKGQGKECIYMYDRITLLYNINQPNTVNQLYFN